jgi:hypothetical protein
MHQASLNGPREKGSPEESMAARIGGPEKVRIRATKGAKTGMTKRSQEYRPGQISREKGVIGTGQAKVAEDRRRAETGIIKESRERVLFRRKGVEEASVEKVVAELEGSQLSQGMHGTKGGGASTGEDHTNDRILTALKSREDAGREKTNGQTKLKSGADKGLVNLDIGVGTPTRQMHTLTAKEMGSFQSSFLASEEGGVPVNAIVGDNHAKIPARGKLGDGKIMESECWGGRRSNDD